LGLESPQEFAARENGLILAGVVADGDDSSGVILAAGRFARVSGDRFFEIGRDWLVRFYFGHFGLVSFLIYESEVI
jgi:hypothetical protein